MLKLTASLLLLLIHLIDYLTEKILLAILTVHQQEVNLGSWKTCFDQLEQTLTTTLVSAYDTIIQEFKTCI
jgi:hypothetical protein